MSEDALDDLIDDAGDYLERKGAGWKTTYRLMTSLVVVVLQREMAIRREKVSEADVDADRLTKHVAELVDPKAFKIGEGFHQDARRRKATKTAERIISLVRLLSAAPMTSREHPVDTTVKP